MNLHPNHSTLADKFTTNYCPTVTVAIPTFNEVDYIENLIYSFLATKYPNLVEIIIVDGGSVDGTQDIVRQISVADAKTILLENPDKIQSAGLNRAAKIATGDIFLRADAHTEYASDYIEECVNALRRSIAVNVGGAQRFIAKNKFQAGVAIAARSSLGSGNAKYRDPKYTGYAETVYLGCFWRDVFTQISGYNPNLAINEDGDLNIRLSEYAARNLNIEPSKAIFISSEIKCWYYPRKTLDSAIVQYFKYGRARRVSSMNHSPFAAVNLRGQIPFLSLATFLTISTLSLFIPHLKVIAVILILLFLGAVTLNAFLATWQTRHTFTSEIWRGDPKSVPSFINRLYNCIVALIATILAQAIGYGYQLISQTGRSHTKAPK
jgi:succinoglycan biosynthesis protein ExoA